MTQTTLKWIALLAMLLDHTAKVLLPPGVLNPIIGIEAAKQLQQLLIVVGRISFPIFAWFAAEGCKYSRHSENRLLRLLLFAALSEIPFQRCFYLKLSLGAHNVLVTILLASAAIWAEGYLNQNQFPAWISYLFPAATAMYFGWVLHTDYNAWGVALVLLLYYIPSKQGRWATLLLWCSCYYLIWHGWSGKTFVWMTASGRFVLWEWLGSLVSVPLLMGYSGVRGRGGKWTFYLFYPLHLLGLFALSKLL